MTKTGALIRNLKPTRQEVRNFIVLTALLTGGATLGAHAAAHHTAPAAICTVPGFAR
jgi:hypothetical protein